MSTYDRDFFLHQKGAVRSARKLLPIVLDLVRPRPRTLVDVGCGIGAWASVAKELGCDVTGMDGEWVPRDRLLIEPGEFACVDLSRPPAPVRRFDMAISLEVGEHLDASNAERFVTFLTELAPVVLFSAAIPFQVGTHHVNEQYPSYWAQQFQARGFDVLDVVRPRCWYDKEIQFFYRQNVLLFVERSLAAHAVAAAPTRQPLDLVHPDAVPILAQGWVDAAGATQCAGYLYKSVKRSLRRRLIGS